MRPRNTGLLQRSVRPATIDPLSQVQSPDGCPNVPAMAESPFASSRCYLVDSGVYRHLGQRYPALIARRTHAPDLCPLLPFAFARSSSPCRLLWIPAAHRPFPTLSLLNFLRVWGPLFRLPLGCMLPFLPPRHWPSPERKRVGASQIPTAISVGSSISEL